MSPEELIAQISEIVEDDIPAEKLTSTIHGIATNKRKEPT